MKKSGAEFLLTTTFPQTSLNRDTKSPMWRSLNLEHDPFNFPKPLMLINEQCAHDPGYPDKSLGLWRLEDIVL